MAAINLVLRALFFLLEKEASPGNEFGSPSPPFLVREQQHGSHDVMFKTRMKKSGPLYIHTLHQNKKILEKNALCLIMKKFIREIPFSLTS